MQGWEEPDPHHKRLAADGEYSEKYESYDIDLFSENLFACPLVPGRNRCTVSSQMLVWFQCHDIWREISSRFVRFGLGLGLGFTFYTFVLIE